jgi:hypothetical protein
VARISSSGVVDQAAVVPAGGPGRGDVAKIAFTAPNDGWLVTSDGWVFHYTDGTALPEDPDPAFRGPITFRPNEAAEQFIPDTPPADDSELFKPPPIELQQGPPAPPVKRLKALLRNIKTKLRGKTLVVRFVLSRKARVGLIARRKRKLVARTRSRMMRPGKHVLRLRLERRRWPTSLRLSAREPGVPTGGGGGDSGDTVTTGGDAIATGTRGR